MLYKSLGGLFAALVLGGAAHASVTVQIWTDQPTAGANATIAQAAGLGAANGTTTVGSIDFTSASGYTVGTFLNNPSGLSSTVFNHDLNNTYMLFTGQTFLNAGANSFVVPHDDGLELFISGIGTVLSQPGPTSPVNTPFTITAPSAGLYNFTMSYGEVFGAPARLAWTVNGAPVGGVPEPATWALMLTGIGAVGAVLRRGQRRRSAFA